MAGPLSGIAGAPQQIPLATPSQPTQGQQAIRERAERDPTSNDVQPQGTQAAQSQDTGAQDQNALQDRLDAALAENFEPATNNDQPRGSIIDIAV